MMKVYLLLLLLLPLLCSAEEYRIRCYGEDQYLVTNLLLDCRSNVEQACYTKGKDKGCIRRENCSKPGWTCCYTDGCNA